MYAAYESLPGRLQARIVGLRVKHDGTYNSGGYVRAGVDAHRRSAHGTRPLHPLVCQHPETGRRMLTSAAAATPISTA